MTATYFSLEPESALHFDSAALTAESICEHKRRVTICSFQDFMRQALVVCDLLKLSSTQLVTLMTNCIIKTAQIDITLLHEQGTKI